MASTDEESQQGADSTEPTDLPLASELIAERVAGTAATEEEIESPNSCLERRGVSGRIRSIAEGVFTPVDHDDKPDAVQVSHCMGELGLSERLNPAIELGVEAMPDPDLLERIDQATLEEIARLQASGVEVVLGNGPFGEVTYELSDVIRRRSDLKSLDSSDPNS